MLSPFSQFSIIYLSSQAQVHSHNQREITAEKQRNINEEETLSSLMRKPTRNITTGLYHNIRIERERSHFWSYYYTRWKTQRFTFAQVYCQKNDNIVDTRWMHETTIILYVAISYTSIHL